MGSTTQKILIVLRKLGILRYGATSYTYTSGKDMPARALMDDVYDEEKDLVTRKDFEVLKRTKSDSTQVPERFCRRCGAPLSPETSLCSRCSKAQR